MGQPSIEVRANYLGKLPGADPHYHLLIVVRDGNGNNTYYRGGPDDNVTPSGGSSGTTGSGRSSSGSSGGSSGRSFGTGGKLVTESGAYTPDSIDYDRDAVVIYKASLNPEKVSEVKNSLANQMSAISKAKINYFATGPNSNSTVGTALRNIGIDIQIPKGMWAPGFEQQLVNQNGRRASIEVEGTSAYANNSDVRTNLNEAVFSLKGNNSDLGEALSILDKMKQGSGFIASNISNNPGIAASKDLNIVAGLEILDQIKKEQQSDKEPALSNVVDQDTVAPSRSRDNGIGGR